MAVEYNDYGELTMEGTSLKTVAQSFGTLLSFMMKIKSVLKCADIMKHLRKAV